MLTSFSRSASAVGDSLSTARVMAASFSESVWAGKILGERKINRGRNKMLVRFI
jgi:hypothetical protein